MPHLHFMMDAYGTIEEHANNLMAINELLNIVSTELNLHPVMPPFLVPYYYCNDAEDGGISAFLICKGGHVTIHTFPYRSCYFVDVLSDEFFSTDKVEKIVKEQLHADNTIVKTIDRRTIYDNSEEKIEAIKDFGPHYMIEVSDIDLTMEWIYHFLDNIAEKINMLAIIRPYVICDRKNNPNFISGMLIVAQSHIAVHYDIHERKAMIDIFSCEFIGDKEIREILDINFGNKWKCKLFSRGSKHTDRYKRKENRLAISKVWVNNI